MTEYTFYNFIIFKCIISLICKDIAKARHRMKHGEGQKQMSDEEETHSTAPTHTHTHSHLVSHTSTKCSSIVPSLQRLSDSTNEKREEGLAESS